MAIQTDSCRTGSQSRSWRSGGGYGRDSHLGYSAPARDLARSSVFAYVTLSPRNFSLRRTQKASAVPAPIFVFSAREAGGPETEASASSDAAAKTGTNPALGSSVTEFTSQLGGGAARKSLSLLYRSIKTNVNGSDGRLTLSKTGVLLEATRTFVTAIWAGNWWLW